MARDDANIQVVEAVMVAIIILTGMIFMTVTTRPQPVSTQGGLDMNALAQDTLEYFADTTLIDPDNSTRNLTMVQWVDALVNGSTRGEAVADTIESELDLILPVGVEAALVLSNGHASHVLVPDLDGGSLGGRAGAVGQAFILPNWTALGDSAATALTPGEAYDFSAYACIKAPTGHSTAPQSQTWIAQWTSEVPGQDEIPASALYGVWELHILAGCTDGTPATIQVVREGGTATPLPAYALQLVVWALA